MSTRNAEQIADWNGCIGQRWSELQRETEDIVRPFGAQAMELAAPRPGERVIDVGCGCGDTAIELARRVGGDGRVVGIDVSRPMLEVARAAAAAAGGLPLEFLEADASAAALPGDIDLLYSRFGVMFFGEPAHALQHLRGALRPGGRFVFACWRAPRDNPWTMVPLSAARQATGVTPPPADPHAPGPFAFADEARLRGLLADAGYEDVDVQRFDAPVTLGTTLRAAAENTIRIGPTSRFVLEVGAEYAPVITDAVERALAPWVASDGRVSLSGSTWIVSARNP